MPKLAQDKTNKTITAEITHFSDYVPGVGSYSVDEGGTPNSWYFKTNNERVDTYNGTLYIDCTDLNIKGRGLDLVLERRFSSDMFLQNYTSSHSGWNWIAPNSPNLENEGYYKIARGWSYKLPAFKHPNTIYPCSNPYFNYYSSSGTTYALYDVIAWEGTQEDHTYPKYIDGYILTLNGSYSTITIPREKIVLSYIRAQFCSYGSCFYYPTSLAVSYPDGRKMTFKDSAGVGKVQDIYDASGINNIHFGYDNNGSSPF